MKKKPKSSKKNRFPKGLNESRVRAIIDHYERQSDDQAAAEDDAIFNEQIHTFMQIPRRLVPAVRKLLKKKAS